MIQKIKCFFGFHNWTKGYLSQSGTWHQDCLVCSVYCSDGDIYNKNRYL